MSNIGFVAPPTVAEFMRSDGFFRIVLGPVGSGKTTGCIFELLRRSIEQRPDANGVRFTRWAVVRQTLKQLEDTVLKDIQQWLGQVSRYLPSKKTIQVKFQAADGTYIDSEWILIPLEDPEDQRRLLSSQLTGAWMSEAIEMSVDLVPAIQGRCGRFPSAVQGGASWFGVIADTNFPSIGSDWHTALEVKRAAGWEVFKQPGGMEEDAENLEWLRQTPESMKLHPGDERRRDLGRGYYRDLMANPNEDWQNRYVHAKYGADPSGQTVFRSTLKPHHISNDLEPCRNRNLIISQDFGRNPFGLIGQLDDRERLLILEEISAEGIGLAAHIQENLKPALLQERYIGLPYYVVGDPSGISRGQVFDESPFTHLKKEGFNAYPAPTNDINKRIAAVEGFFTKNYADGPSILIDAEKCPILVEALMSKYRYAKRRNGQFAPLPEKLHPWSDVADALQYLCLAAGSGLGHYIAGRLNNVRVAPVQARRRVSAGGWT